MRQKYCMGRKNSFRRHIQHPSEFSRPEENSYAAFNSYFPRQFLNGAQPSTTWTSPAGSWARAEATSQYASMRPVRATWTRASWSLRTLTRPRLSTPQTSSLSSPVAPPPPSRCVLIFVLGVVLVLALALVLVLVLGLVSFFLFLFLLSVVVMVMVVVVMCGGGHGV